MLSLLRRILPRWAFVGYHRFLAWLAAVLSGFPSRRLIVIGVTGTNGKSTVVHLIARICEEAGLRVGLTSTVEFQIGDDQYLNAEKMTMLGRFALRRLLRKMVRAGCDVAILETSSEGIAQYRHAHIAYDIAVFTNLTPEHIESHGSYAAYRAAKGKLFAALKGTMRKQLRGKPVLKSIVLNIGDSESPFFRTFWAERYIGFADGRGEQFIDAKRLHERFIAEDVVVEAAGSRFTVCGQRASLKLLGLVNVENALAAIAAVSPLGISVETSIRALAKVHGVPGRFEFVQREPFAVLVDYAPEPASLNALYAFLELLPRKRIFHVLGSTGGGRDAARRAVLGRIAAEHADVVIVTNEDPYDDDPQQIIRDVARGAEGAGAMPNERLFTIVDRREALMFAVHKAQEGDLVLVTGKGSEQAMVVHGGRKIPWDDRRVLREILRLQERH